MRFIDNFSGGTRGALSAENFLQVSQHDFHHIQLSLRHPVPVLLGVHAATSLQLGVRR